MIKIVETGINDKIIFKWIISKVAASPFTQMWVVRTNFLFSMY